jgi:hypothetical protein
MNSRKTGPGSAMNITLCPYAQNAQNVPICAHFGVVQSDFLLNFDIDNCLLKKFHYMYIRLPDID